MNERAREFLEKHGMLAEKLIPSQAARAMKEDMERGLAGEKSSMPMIPAWLSNEGSLQEGQSAVVIDAGGTNFRCALLHFEKEGYRLEGLKKCKMPGIESPASWETFITFIADQIEPLMAGADGIGFCFSYSAHITPEMDGKVICIDKEVNIEGSAGQLVGASLLQELERRGITGKRVVILNDTVAVLLGGSAGLDKTAYSGFAGQVSGTGTNTCCSLPLKRIGKLGRNEEKSILVNLESGMYDGIPGGDYDREVDQASANPGQKHFEKLTAGVYLGDLLQRMLQDAAREGYLSPEGTEKAKALGKIDASVLNKWSFGEELEIVSGSSADADFIKSLCVDLFQRSARCMCTNLLAIMLLTGEGTEEEKPFCVCAEGSLAQKGRVYRPCLERLLQEEGEKMGLYAVLKVVEESTLPGAAAAAILNA